MPRKSGEPPETLVRKLKHREGVDNPWALARYIVAKKRRRRPRRNDT